jgi:hypothetical protein
MKNQQYKDPTEEKPLEDEPEDDDSALALDELDFSDEPPPPTFGELENDPDIESDDIFAQAREAGLTEAALPGHGPTADDLTPETLIHEDGAISPHEPGGDEANDQHLTVIDEGDMEGDDEIEEDDSDELTQLNTTSEDTLDENLILDDGNAVDDELDEDDDMNESEEDDNEGDDVATGEDLDTRK